MLQLVRVRHKHTPHDSLYEGDRPEDEQAAQRAGVPFQWAWDWTCATSRGERPLAVFLLCELGKANGKAHRQRISYNRNAKARTCCPV